MPEQAPRRFSAESLLPARPVRRSLRRRLGSFLEPRAIWARRRLSLPRVLPDFIIIGARKSGTTFLYQNLVSQRGFLPAYKKEVQFFDKFHGRGVDWYRAHFPTGVAMAASARWTRRPVLTGEASPLYLFHPRAPERIRHLLPDVKLIVLLRNPVDRAYSHYGHQLRRGIGAATFEGALENEATFEQAQAAEELRLLTADEDYISEPRQVLSYQSGGRYLEQLEHWYRLFPAGHILVLRSEELFNGPDAELARVTGFLGGPAQDVKIVHEYRERNVPAMKPETRKRLEDYFKPHNRRLYRFLADRGYDFTPWER